MPQTGEARSWWADVEHVRETIERRREAEERASAARSDRHLFVVGDRHGGGAHATGRRAADRHTGERRSADRRAAGPRTAELRVVERRDGERRAGERREGTVESSPGERRGGHRAGPRRTVEITGRTVPAPAVPRSSGDPTVAYGARGTSRRPSLSPADRLIYRPDRIAMWAVVLGFVLILVAATSA